MLKNSFIHIPSIGEVKERRIWESGIPDWYTYIKKAHNDELPDWLHEGILTSVEHSCEHLENNDHKYFKEKLPNREQWRVFGEFKPSTVYLDIETTGLDFYYHDITLVGLFDGRKVKSFVKDQNIEDLPMELEKYNTIVTFNGNMFDLPFICTKFPGLNIDQIQLDLRFILKRLGFRGGLKKIEKEMGISRTNETSGLSGLDAIRLWRQYEKGNQRALETLIKYNTEDIVNLEHLMNFAYQRLRERTLYRKIK